MAPNRGAFERIVTTNTSASSIVAGGTTGSASTGTGGFIGGTVYASVSVETNLLFSLIGQALIVRATAPAGGSGGAAGVNLTLQASAATVGSGAGYNAGGAVAITAGDAVGQTTGSANGGAVTITAGNAAGASGTPSAGSITLVGGTGVNGLSSAGGNVVLTGGAGGSPSGSVLITGGASASNGATSGSIVIAGGSPSAGTSTTAGSVTIKTGDVQNTSGLLLITTGTYPASYAAPGTVITIKPSDPLSSTSSPATVGGAVVLEGGPGQPNNSTALGSGTAGAGGTLTIKSGVGGASTVAGNTRLGGDGGTLTVLGNDGGNAPGAGGVTNTGGAGGNLVLGSGAGGTGSTANGAVGTITLKSGATTVATVDAAGLFTHVLAVNSAGAVGFTGYIAPTTLAANTNDWAPTGLSTCNVIRVAASGIIDITGIVAQASGRLIVLYNSSTHAITLKHDATSTAANRFFCPNATDYALDQKESVWIRYDGTDSRWCLIASNI